MAVIAAVTFVCDHPDIQAISFVGSDQAVSFTFFALAHLSHRNSVCLSICHTGESVKNGAS